MTLYTAYVEVFFIFIFKILRFYVKCDTEYKFLINAKLNTGKRVPERDLIERSPLTLWRRNYFFNFSTPVYKM